MNALSSSECSNGDESGWTLYLEHSFLKQNDDSNNKREEEKVKEMMIMEEEEDLSMVSDASSGPPHFAEEEAYFNYEDNDYGCFNYPPVSSKSVKLEKNKTTKKKQKVSLLDDTASSPVFDFSKNNITVTNQQGSSTESVVDYSQGFSATYFEERSSFQDHFGFLQSSISQNELQLQNNQWFGGKRQFY
ncbi:uncharacterized protein G2W53_032069 [Senna tora]|uniref:Uncharacterized protein n=1 Tax=Senna tora TaxID=362788 RepID=A0A834SWY3_9FABA|nr:uncharacterized protein G2W53_032069 [Senna tora]